MSGCGSVQPPGSASQCESGRDYEYKTDGHTPTKLPLDTYFNFLSIVRVKKCYSPHLSSVIEKKKKSFHVWRFTGTGCQTLLGSQGTLHQKDGRYCFAITAFLIRAGTLSLWTYTANHRSSGSQSDTVTRSGGRSLRTQHRALFIYHFQICRCILMSI